MSSTPPSPNSAAPVPVRPPRFSWPVRLLIFLVLFDMVVRATGVMYPWKDWLSEFKVERLPQRLPTPAELARLQQEADGSYGPVYRELRQSAASLPRFLNPVPSDETRALLTSTAAWCKYGLAWTVSRLGWCETVLNIDQEWAMFSPNVSRRKYPARVRLFFADGSETVVRLQIDPPDYTSYWRGMLGKNLGPELHLDADDASEACYGYCNWLTHVHPQNAQGSPLREIRLYQFDVHFPPPTADARAWLQEQMERTRDHRAPQARHAFFVYDAQTRQGRFGEFTDR